MKVTKLSDLLMEELKDIYSSEKQILAKGLPSMIKAAQDSELKQGFMDHLEQTKGHIERLNQVFELMNSKPVSKKCHGMEGVITEGGEIVEMKLQDELLIAGLVAAGLKVEHYEIASYEAVIMLSKKLGLKDVQKLLEVTLKEEKDTSIKLTDLANDKITSDK